MNVPLVVTEFLTRARTLYGDATAVICGHDRLTYAQLGKRIDRLSNALRNIGVRQGNVVAYLSFNCHRLLEGYYAAPQMGAILLPINVRLKPDDITYILKDAEAHTIVVDRALAHLLAPKDATIAALRNVILMGPVPDKPIDIEGEDYEALIASESDNFVPPSIAEDDPAELFYTSGTTAHPKGVVLTHRNMYLHAFYALAGLGGYDDGAVQLHSIPLFHVNGWGTPHFVTLIGGRHVMLSRFDPEEVLATIERERVTHVFLVPTMAQALIAAPTFGSRDLTSLRRIKLGGAAAPPEVVRQLSQRLPHCLVTCGYGLTETSPILSVAKPKSTLDLSAEASVTLRSTAGLSLPGVSVEILDDNGQPLLHDGKAIGEICVRSNVVAKGYWKLPDETERAVVNGWFRTGDMGTIDSEGYLNIVDRKKDIIITGGENVASIDVEMAIYRHPAVAECAVIGAADHRWGEVPVAFVVRKPGCDLDEATVIRHCRNVLAHFKVPKRVILVDVLPKGGTGKILKRELRELV